MLSPFLREKKKKETAFCLFPYCFRLFPFLFPFSAFLATSASTRTFLTESLVESPLACHLAALFTLLSGRSMPSHISAILSNPEMDSTRADDQASLPCVRIPA